MGLRECTLQVLFPSDVIDFAMLPALSLRDFGGKQFHCWMSRDLEVTNESARCRGEKVLVILEKFI